MMQVISDPHMTDQHQFDFDRIAQAIRFLKEGFREQPGLEEVAAAVNMSPFHFQRMFSEWAGVTPKQFLQHLSISHARQLLLRDQASVSDAAFETGLSGTGRLHDLFVRIEAMTPGEFRNGGADLHINHAFQATPFGRILVASTKKGICHLAFVDAGDDQALSILKNRFPQAVYLSEQDDHQQQVREVFARNWDLPTPVRLHLRASPFQLKVWEMLLRIPAGAVTSYAGLARRSGQPTASRAVGTAVGSNPVAMLIPCHRVILGNGDTGQYHWGADRKAAMLGRESVRAGNS